MFLGKSPLSLVATMIALSLLAPAMASAQTSERSGFTFLVNAGVGVQNDSALEATSVGLAGANIGIGGFVTDQVAILGRFSGTVAPQELCGFFACSDFTQVSGVLAPTVQFWPSDKVAIEAGGGMGFWQIDDSNERSFGLILGTAFTVLNRGKHNLQVGFEYAPVFAEDGAIHNFGFTVGYQLF